MMKLYIPILVVFVFYIYTHIRQHLPKISVYTKVYISEITFAFCHENGQFSKTLCGTLEISHHLALKSIHQWQIIARSRAGHVNTRTYNISYAELGNEFNDFSFNSFFYSVLFNEIMFLAI